jgi:hypothetical protein
MTTASRKSVCRRVSTEIVLGAIANSEPDTCLQEESMQLNQKWSCTVADEQRKTSSKHGDQLYLIEWVASSSPGWLASYSPPVPSLIDSASRLWTPATAPATAAVTAPAAAASTAVS